jgi:hypothetical protein
MTPENDPEKIFCFAFVPIGPGKDVGDGRKRIVRIDCDPCNRTAGERVIGELLCHLDGGTHVQTGNKAEIKFLLKHQLCKRTQSI